MEHTNDILNELTSWGSPLADMPRTMPYTIPYGYFEDFAETAQCLITTENETDPVTAWAKETPYTVPLGYFDQFPAQALAGIRSNEIMTGLPKSMPFASPLGYFEAFPAQMLDAAKNAGKEVKIIPVKRHTIAWQLRWAAAAVLLICISLGAYRSFVRPPFDTEKALATVPKSEINAYVQQNIDDFDMDVIVSNLGVNNGVAIQPKQLNNKEIIEYLNENGWQDTE